MNAPSDPSQHDQNDLESAFLGAFERYGDQLFRHACLRLSDREKALDAVQDTFTRAWSYLRQGHRVESYRPFLYKILNNLIIDEYRRRSDASLEAEMEEAGDERAITALSAHETDALIATLDGRQALALLPQVPEKYREVLVLRFIDELRPKEIAALLEISENIVSVRIHRGLHVLRAMIEREEVRATHRRRDPRSHGA